MRPNLLLRSFSKFYGVLLIVALAALPGYAQPVLVSGSGNFGLQSVGAPANTGPSTLVYTFTNNFVQNIPSVVTQGIPNADFQMTGGTCSTGSYYTGNSCTVQVTFTP